MATLKDFKEWLEEEGFEGAEDMMQIYRPVKDGETGWKYELTPARGAAGNFIVTGGVNNLLLTPKSREAFVRYMDGLFEVGVEVQSAFDHAMEKDD